jgi:co-chaperonin GroES (HSP10)
MISGTLAAIGPQAWKAFGPNFTGEPWANVGDRVYFAQYSGKIVKDPDTGEEYKLMNDEDITAVVAAGKENG